MHFLFFIIIDTVAFCTSVLPEGNIDSTLTENLLPVKIVLCVAEKLFLCTKFPTVCQYLLITIYYKLLFTLRHTKISVCGSCLFFTMKLYLITQYVLGFPCYNYADTNFVLVNYPMSIKTVFVLYMALLIIKHL